ncbi:hypothetical protein DFR67_101248 [Williamsia limnetica]|jgi:hypothetical protein|uniref:Uncharacterized protein n=1 Tax=Williamsia limnetica TaxID=882452 RepID=A0A318RPP7_WILLI|nr:hypothetical protein [Williamsia limnetica]PYE20857.1 hypothetical protein DFR67_101248 [Williamsia limnetica]
METAANILLIIAGILLAVAAFSSYKLHARSNRTNSSDISNRDNSSDVLTRRVRALAAGVAAIVLASSAIPLNSDATGIWIGGIVLIAISLATIARASTSNSMYSRTNIHKDH